MKAWFKKAVIGLAVILMLLGFAVPAVTSAYNKRRMLQAVQNARSIHLATLSLMHDGFPGDLKARGLKTVGDFAEILVREGNLKPSDLGIFSGPGFKPYQGKLDANGHLDPPFTDENCAYRIYLVRDSDPGSTVFLTSKPSPGSVMRIVARKGGDVSLYKQLPAGVETATPENCLNP